MIGKASRGTQFSGLLRYLTEQDQARLLGYRNLPQDGSETAATLMQLTAQGSERTKKPVYHLSLRAAPHDRRLRDQEWIKLAEAVLNDLGLADHQALIIRHGDRRSDHIHLAINRVHPQTLKAAPLRHDYKIIEDRLRRAEIGLGLERTSSSQHVRTDAPGRYGQPESASKRSQGAFQEKRRQGWSRSDTIKQAVQFSVKQALNAQPDDLSRAFSTALREHGCMLARGDRRGLVVVTSDGSIASLSRCLPDRDVRIPLTQGIATGALPSVERAISILQEREKALLSQMNALPLTTPSQQKNATALSHGSAPATILGALAKGFVVGEQVAEQSDAADPTRQFRLSGELKRLLARKKMLERQVQRQR